MISIDIMNRGSKLDLIPFAGPVICAVRQTVRANQRDFSRGTMCGRIKERGLDKLYIAGVSALHFTAAAGLYALTYLTYNN